MGPISPFYVCKDRDPQKPGAHWRGAGGARPSPGTAAWGGRSKAAGGTSGHLQAQLCETLEAPGVDGSHSKAPRAVDRPSDARWPPGAPLPSGPAPAAGWQAARAGGTRVPPVTSRPAEGANASGVPPTSVCLRFVKRLQ